MTNAVVTIQKLGQKLNVQPITTDDCNDDGSGERRMNEKRIKM